MGFETARMLCESRMMLICFRTYANCANIGHLDAKSGNFRILNPLNPPYQGDFKRECVSPMFIRIISYQRVGWIERERTKNRTAKMTFMVYPET